ncbi:MAG: 4Fe-4S binding protein [Paludibacter sp.]|nr:4Fe-4S binding protein [Paludibacter sp.]
MFGKGQNQRNKFQQRGMGSTSFGVCSCPKCNYSVTHQRGVPCTTLICPNCNIPLVRQDKSENSKSNNSNNSNNINKQQVPNKTTKIKDFPKIDTELCIGCGTCVDKCPSEAIHMEDGKAKITIANCKKCRACVSVCPVGAIA